jgi:hypothetical protein
MAEMAVAIVQRAVVTVNKPSTIIGGKSFANLGCAGLGLSRQGRAI